MYVCLWSPGWSTGEASPGGEGGATRDLAPLLADFVPRLCVESERIWADGRGLDVVALAKRLLDRLEEEGVVARAGVAALPIAAQLAARWGPRDAAPAGGPTPFLVKERTGWGWRSSPGGEGKAEGSPPASGVVVVEPGREAAWLSSLPVAALRPDDRLRTLLEGVGVDTVGALAGLSREAVEVRFGPAAVALWRLARADDRRRLFAPVPPERPHGSIDFVDYVLTDPSRLLFTANALLGPLCDRLVSRGEHARGLRITLPLANGESWERTIRPARPTASRDTWLRLIRGLLERLTVPDAVAGMRVEVGATEPAAVRQGDLFDRGFASASAVEAAVARLAERQVVPVASEVAAHPRVERRARWREVALEAVVRGRPPGVGGASALALQLLATPRRVGVEAAPRRDHQVPVRVRDRSGWQAVPMAAGPDRISGGQWEDAPYAREYFRCVTEEGVQLWLYRDALDGEWYLHGYWD